MTLGKTTGNFKTQFTVAPVFNFLQANKHDALTVILSTAIEKKATIVIINQCFSIISGPCPT